ncbi:hypothetical protein IWX90DRAFT_140963 [Phyllosticta citrichinensis]|uniref:Uncharacterized protein n=1 Tax=Phyllosticta citrichinensis TaxID=1130410 RepID=A0ABR1XZ25_9PEZI
MSPSSRPKRLVLIWTVWQLCCFTCSPSSPPDVAGATRSPPLMSSEPLQSCKHPPHQRRSFHAGLEYASQLCFENSPLFDPLPPPVTGPTPSSPPAYPVISLPDSDQNHPQAETKSPSQLHSTHFDPVFNHSAIVLGRKSLGLWVHDRLTDLDS